MKIVAKRLLRGPNLYAPWPCLQAVVDLQELDDVPSSALEGFTERLCALLPSLHEHRCSPGVPGGFVQRLRDGTYMAHIVEHVLLELQCLAGSEVGFGRARKLRGAPRQHTIVCAYRVEALVEPALDAALALVSAVAQGQAPDVQALLAPLKKLVARHGTGPSTQAILQAARRRGIPTIRLSDEASLYQLGYGARHKRIQATLTGDTGHVATGIASDKQLTRTLLAQAGLPVPRGMVVSSAADAVRAAASLRGPVVVKPADANHGKGVRTRPHGEAEIVRAYEYARQYSGGVIVETFIEGSDYRVLVVAGKVVAAARREPPCVIGDGAATVAQLIAAENRNPLRGEGHTQPLTRIPVDESTELHLTRQGLTLHTVPGHGVRVYLRDNANLSSGGTAEDVTDRIHPLTALACERAVRQIGLDVAGVDLVCRDIGAPLQEQQGAIIEINAAPGIRMHEFPSAGAPRPAGRAIVDALFPQGQDGRIPIVAVTGTNGKTTTTLLVASAFKAAGLVTGVTTTEGVFIGERLVTKGDCTGYWSARTVLTSPDVQAAVLETARGGILKRGLGYDRCDVAVVLNVSADHLGLDGIHTLDELARVKCVVAASARKAVVLNAEDARCVAMVPRLARGVEVVYFSTDEHNPVLRAHLRQGGRAVYLRDGEVVLATGGGHIGFFRADALAVTLNGRARHNVANTLAAVAALAAQGCPHEAIVQGIGSFRCTTESNPLRLNLFDVSGVTVMLDYAHNPAAYRAILHTVRALQPGRVVGVITAPGDRRDAELREVGRLCGAGLDEMLVYETDELRTRERGQTASVLLEGARSANPAVPPRCVLDVRQAIGQAFMACRPGDLLLVGCATQVYDLGAAISRLALVAPHKVAERKVA